MVKRTTHRKQTKATLKRRKHSQHTQYRKSVGSFGHEAIAKAWDVKATLNQNYARLGLAVSPNDAKEMARQNASLTAIDIDEDAAVVSAALQQRVTEEEQREEEEESHRQIPSLDPQRHERRTRAAAKAQELMDAIRGGTAQELAAIPPPAKVPKAMALSEQRRLMQLRTKHGDNFTAMTRDIALNAHQLTVAQLKKSFVQLDQLQALVSDT